MQIGGDANGGRSVCYQYSLPFWTRHLPPHMAKALITTTATPISMADMACPQGIGNLVNHSDKRVARFSTIATDASTIAIRARRLLAAKLFPSICASRSVASSAIRFVLSLYFTRRRLGGPCIALLFLAYIGMREQVGRGLLRYALPCFAGVEGCYRPSVISLRLGRGMRQSWRAGGRSRRRCGLSSSSFCG